MNQWEVWEGERREVRERVGQGRNTRLPSLEEGLNSHANRERCVQLYSFRRVLFCLITQRLKAERELNRDMKETEATESREKKNKLVGERTKFIHY